jgi:hypothetical protein
LKPFKVVDCSNAEQFYNNLIGMLSRLDSHFKVGQTTVTYLQQEDELNTYEDGNAVFFLKGETFWTKKTFELSKEDWSGWFND